jgi:hypothetical protein
VVWPLTRTRSLLSSAYWLARRLRHLDDKEPKQSPSPRNARVVLPMQVVLPGEHHRILPPTQGSRPCAGPPTSRPSQPAALVETERHRIGLTIVGWQRPIRRLVRQHEHSAITEGQHSRVVFDPADVLDHVVGANVLRALVPELEPLAVGLTRPCSSQILQLKRRPPRPINGGDQHIQPYARRRPCFQPNPRPWHSLLHRPPERLLESASEWNTGRSRRRASNTVIKFVSPAISTSRHYGRAESDVRESGRDWDAGGVRRRSVTFAGMRLLPDGQLLDLGLERDAVDNARQHRCLASTWCGHADGVAHDHSSGCFGEFMPKVATPIRGVEDQGGLRVEP